ncbi:MAG: response regulator [Cyclobacteriaceae bacterium]|nr:response regulator [Cyclobacteriaceae bacterium]
MKSICVVEDTPDLLENLAAFLALEGFQVIACSSALDALDKLTIETPDLIVTDLWMPGMDGFTFIDQLKSNPAWTNIPVLVFTAAPLKPDERERLLQKTKGIVVKPVPMEDFLDSIKSYFNTVS